MKRRCMSSTWDTATISRTSARTSRSAPARCGRSRPRIRVQRPEHEAAIGLDARHLRQVEFRVLEVACVALRPGNAAQPTPIFYSYAYPPPAGFAEAKVQPAAAFYSQDLREFVLPYDAVREADSPDEMLLAFAQSTYDAASLLGNWEREKLDEATLHPPAR